MFNISNREDINVVFTPRSSTVNFNTYVERDKIESELYRKAKGTQNIILYGESGCGKSWLYKKVFNEKKIHYKEINLAYAESNDGILNLMMDEAGEGLAEKVSYSEGKSAEATAYVVKGGLVHTANYSIGSTTAVYKYLDRFFKNKPGFICLENAEAIFDNSKMMKELGTLILILDDERFAKYKTRFIIVGVPSGILRYYSNAKNLQTVANRLVEVSEVVQMDKQQVIKFVEKCFVEQLKVVFTCQNDKDSLCEHLFYITGGVPQRMHEYSTVLAYLLEEENWIFSELYLGIADKMWLKDSLYQNYEVIQQLMNSENTFVGRRNQVLYCLGLLTGKSFSIADLENLVRNEFPSSSDGTILNLSIPLGDIVEYKTPFITKHAKSYYISDMKYILCIRAMLKNENEKIIRIDLNNL